MRRQMPRQLTSGSMVRLPSRISSSAQPPTGSPFRPVPTMSLSPLLVVCDTAVIAATLDLEGGTNYNVAAVGLLADITATVFTTDTMDLGADTARVQVIHASPDAPAVDIAVTGGDVLVPGLEFPNASGALDVAAGSYDLEVRVAGTRTLPFRFRVLPSKPVPSMTSSPSAHSPTAPSMSSS